MATKKVKAASYQVRIPREVLKHIQAYAKRHNRSVNDTMVRALAQFVGADAYP